MVSREKIRVLLQLLPLFLLGAPTLARAHTAENPYRTDLNIRGGAVSERKVGEVLVWNDAVSLHVKYRVTAYGPSVPGDSWCLIGARLQVAANLRAIPANRGEPLPEEFEHRRDLDCVQETSFVIPNTWVVGTPLFVAANAQVRKLSGLGALEELLPESATVQLKHNPAGAASYFDVTVSNGDFLNGRYDGWCVDTRRRIDDDTLYNAKVYATTGSVPAGTVDFPENLDLVNWVLNQNFVGKTAAGGQGVYTFGDVQRAIWALIDNRNADPDRPWDPDRVNQILGAAHASGENYVPACNQALSVLLVPENAGGEPIAQAFVVQSSLINLGLPCESELATVWGGTFEFPCKGKNCSTDSDARFFNYLVQ